mmetsp:Transcript_25659/g.62871  ORF Transcript_25659/g.62871 Transcript_25659/m.62871 type:complete len:131 (+) Transcript_25659:158-550(+)|eukprot:CAMPEP_0113634120 /NCGR_PEP_ID=MMETSP0017_2-20120614/17765_1 /TAXON_ID=2856 /ORGANISM="Cylindrotheca closterium" /LENGTH=130 /DNA_ID=CAMNT_0000544803 /DNA_START=134 /DNA_END=526 /DNA_ORIENTATION=+ /assembly_acc=CAM_ASM_000147
MVKIISTLALLAALFASSSAFTVLPSQKAAVTASSSTEVSMGLFDFFSDEAKEKREAKRQREIEEQERLQKAIMERRRNPDLMEEYEANVQYRRELKMQDKFDEASEVDLYKRADDETLLDGTTGSQAEK